MSDQSTPLPSPALDATHQNALSEAAPHRPRFNGWRALCVVLLLLLLLGSATALSLFEQFKAQLRHLQTQLQSRAQIRFVAVLTDAQGQPEVLATFDAQEQGLTLQRFGRIHEGRADSLQLWALPLAGPPRSLGLLGASGKALRIAVPQAALEGVRELAVSVETKGGVSDQAGPSGALLVRGALLQRAL